MNYKLAVEVMTLNYPFIGEIIFCDSSDNDFLSLKDTYPIPSEVNKFAIVKSIDKIIENVDGEDIADTGERMLSEGIGDSYLIPARYDGYIHYELDGQKKFLK